MSRFEIGIQMGRWCDIKTLVASAERYCRGGCQCQPGAR